MKNKIVLITGSTDGIGKETALQLAQLGATVIVHGRSAERCQAACDDIRQATGNPNVDFVVADLSSQRQVRQMAAEVLARTDRLHVLINNAGVIVLKRQLTVDGLETTFAVNHLAPFLLTNLLLDRLKSSAPARIINVSSTVHYDAPLKFDNLQSEKNYNGINAYKQSKLGNVLFTFELAERLKGIGRHGQLPASGRRRDEVAGYGLGLVERTVLGAGCGPLGLSGDLARGREHDRETFREHISRRGFTQSE